MKCRHAEYLETALRMLRRRTTTPKEFTAAEQNYWKQGDTIQGSGMGSWPKDLGLRVPLERRSSPVLSEGQHPQTGEQLVLHRAVHEYKRGREDGLSGGTSRRLGCDLFRTNRSR